ncbi:MAG: ABC transporter substrate-binding protein [Bacteroidales bacterium]|nr:ABC transporter substrate-binding protein [Bacteroidales bacterium]
MFRRFVFLFAALGALLCSCGGIDVATAAEDACEPAFLEIFEKPQGGWTVVSVSPFDGSRDSLEIDRPVERLIVMSTSHYGFLDALGRTDIVVGASGPDYIFSDQAAFETSSGVLTASPGEAPSLASRSEELRLPEPDDGHRFQKPSELAAATRPVDVGYDAAPDYERIVGLKPDVVLTYAVSGAKSPFETRLEQLGIKVFTVNEHLESHPLARAAYIRLFGALTGKMEAADEILAEVRENYTALAQTIQERRVSPRKILLNIPYNDQWFVPSEESYLTAMTRDAGGDVLGCERGKAASSVMSVEKAYSLSKEADLWLNVGWCLNLDQLLGINPIFTDILNNIESNAIKRGYTSSPAVWNDNKRVNSKGGNDIWQSGVARPDLVLRDLVGILHPTDQVNETIYYKPID